MFSYPIRRGTLYWHIYTLRVYFHRHNDGNRISRRAKSYAWYYMYIYSYTPVCIYCTPPRRALSADLRTYCTGICRRVARVCVVCVCCVFACVCTLMGCFHDGFVVSSPTLLQNKKSATRSGTPPSQNSNGGAAAARPVAENFLSSRTEISYLRRYI